MTEYVWSCDSGIFRSWWPKVVSPYKHELQSRHNVQSKTVPNLHRVGYRKFETSSLATYNKKMEELKMGRGFDADETDNISPTEFQETIIDTDGSVVTSVHDDVE